MEKEVAAFQEDATERATKRAKQDRPLKFKKKGHEEQYYFNAQVGDRMEAAAKKIKVTPTFDKEAKPIQDALEELQESMSSLVE